MILNSVMLASGKLYYFEAGKGPALLFLHGAMVTPEAYLPLLTLLAKHYRVIAPMHPGHGSSFTIADTWKVANIADFYLDFLADIGFAPQTVIGHSFGGTIALLLAARGVGKRVVVCNAPYIPFILDPKRYLSHIGAELRKIYRQRPELKEIADLAKAARSLAQTIVSHPEDIPRLFAEPKTLDIQADLGRIAIPIYILWGSEDKIVPVLMATGLQKAVVGSKLTVFSGLTHYYPVTEPDFTYQEIMKVCPVDRI